MMETGSDLHVMDAFHQVLVGDGNRFLIRARQDAAKAWLSEDPARLEELVVSAWPHMAQDSSIGRLFYWRLFQKYRPDLMEQALSVLDEANVQQDKGKIAELMMELVGNTDFVTYPQAAGLLEVCAKSRLDFSDLGRMRHLLLRRVLQVALGDYQADEIADLDTDLRALRDILELGGAAWQVWEGQPHAARDIVHVLIQATALSSGNRQTLVRQRFEDVLGVLVQAGANLEGGVGRDYPRLDSPLQVSIFQWTQATDLHWKLTHAHMTNVLLDAGAAWERALAQVGQHTEAGQLIAQHPAVRRARLMRKITPATQVTEEEGKARLL